MTFVFRSPSRLALHQFRCHGSIGATRAVHHRLLHPTLPTRDVQRAAQPVRRSNAARTLTATTTTTTIMSTQHNSDAAALLVRATERTLEHDDEKGGARYSGRLISDWDIGSVPNGGYSLATALHCAQDLVARRRGGQHADLFHCAVAYLNKVTSAKPYQVHVRTLKEGRAFTNVDAELLQASDKQDGLDVCLRVQIIFADFSALRSDPAMKPYTIAPGDPFGPKFPCPYADRQQTEGLPSWYKPHDTPRVLEDKRAIEEGERNGQLITAKYIYWPREKVQDSDVVRHNLAAIGMFCDMSTDMDSMLPKEIREEAKKHHGSHPWYPTMSLSIEMRQPMPTFALQRMAAFSRIDHVTHGHWSFIVELWSHPDDAELFGLGAPDEGNPKSIVVAVSQQTALTYSMAVNKGKLKGNAGSNL